MAQTLCFVVKFAMDFCCYRLFVWLLCALSAMAASFRELTKGEADALYDIWGVRDMRSLENLVKNPKQFWDERVAALTREGATMSHEEFCKQYVHEAKGYIAAFPGVGANDFWFQEEGAIESVLKEFFEEGSHNFQDLLCAFYARACDCMHVKVGICPHVKPAIIEQVFLVSNQTELLNHPALCDIRSQVISLGILHNQRCEYRTPSGDRYRFDGCEAGEGIFCHIVKQTGDNTSLQVEQKEAVCEALRCNHYKAVQGITKSFLSRLRWQSLEDGKFSMFDSLVMQSLGYYLCGFFSDPKKRYLFSAHNGQFWGWAGVRQHDVNGHAMHLYELEKCRAEIGVPEQKYFNACCNPEALNSGNLVTMSQQVLSWFQQFHELPATIHCFANLPTLSLIFPTNDTLSDPGFRDVVPYFMHVPLEYDWRAAPLKKADVDERKIHNTLLAWRGQYCVQGRYFLQQNDLCSYISMLGKEVFGTCPKRYSPVQIDWHRTPNFFEEMLDFLYEEKCTRGFEKQNRVDFKFHARLLAKDVIAVLQRNCQDKRFMIAAPSAVLFILMTMDALKDLSAALFITICIDERRCLVSGRSRMTLYEKFLS